MYDSYISSDRYEELKDKVDNWVNDGGSATEYDTLMDEIDEAYNSGEISSSSYDNLVDLLSDYA